ncbi:MAG: PAQR family membrane homeostasis protein TrhA [Acidimicrobiales bacterium]
MNFAIPQSLKPHLRGWSHVAACAAAIALCPIVIVFSPGARAAAAVFSGAVIGLFGISAAYHRFHWGSRMEAVMKRLDHSMIFIVIAATYTPIALVALPNGPGTLILRVVWVGAIVGVITRLFWTHAPRAIIVALYIAVGWAAMLVIDDIWRALGVAGFVLLLVGGLLHTVGAVVYATKRPNPWPRWFGFHEIFHLIVIAAIATHYVVVATIALPKGALTT